MLAYVKLDGKSLNKTNNKNRIQLKSNLFINKVTFYEHVYAWVCKILYKKKKLVKEDCYTEHKKYTLAFYDRFKSNKNGRRSSDTLKADADFKSFIGSHNKQRKFKNIDFDFIKIFFC